MTIPKINWIDRENILNPERWIWLELLMDFSIPYGLIRPMADNIPCWNCKSGDLIAISLGDYQDFDKSIRTSIYVYFNDDIQVCPALSSGFIESNTANTRLSKLSSNGGKLFRDVTLNVKRMVKLNQII